MRIQLKPRDDKRASDMIELIDESGLYFGSVHVDLFWQKPVGDKRGELWTRLAGEKKAATVELTIVED